MNNNKTSVDRLSNVSAKAHDLPDVRIFICYRRQDGAWHADWLHRNLKDASFPDAMGKPRPLHVYYDITAPGVADWKKLHFPSLQASRAMVLVCTPGIAKDFSERGRPDWVYEELRWWCNHRKTAPIVVDATGEGDRWLPELILEKWPDINRIDLNKEDASAPENADSDYTARIRDRIIGAIRESEQETVFEDLQRFRRLSKRLTVALVVSVLLFLVASGAVAIALRGLARARAAERIAEDKTADAEEQTRIAEEQTRIAEEQRRDAEEQRLVAEEQRRDAEEQRRIADEQKRIVQLQVIKLLFLPDQQDSDDARDAFYTSLGGTAGSNIFELVNRTISNKTSTHGVVNSLKILECYGPHRGKAYRVAFGKLFDTFGSSPNSDIQFHIDMLRRVVEADQAGRPRPKIPGYDRCQWIREIPRE